jgi:hypothetical protein
MANINHSPEMMFMKNDIEKITAHAAKVLPLTTASLGNEYYYQSLPLCVIDAVFSLGVRYEQVQNVVARYCDHFGLRRIRTPKDTLPPADEQETITAFLEKYERISSFMMATNIFCNQQRTSPTNGILKAEAVYLFAKVLKEHCVENLEDVSRITSSASFEKNIRSIKGQTKGIALQYFFMLAGSDDLVKPDRMVLGFLNLVLGRSVSGAEAQELLSAAAKLLRFSYPHLTPRLLDHEIWKYQRDLPVESEQHPTFDLIKANSNTLPAMNENQLRTIDLPKTNADNNMNNNLTGVPLIMYKVGEILQPQFGINPIPNSKIIEEALRQGYSKKGSIKASDYCYNLVNEDPVTFKFHQKMYLMHGEPGKEEYEFVGLAYPYAGSIYRKKSRWAPKEKVGEWINGNQFFI